ncbi:hypothetical protein EON65_35905 [archaeon]|nr:MAG: hypothetical protein EON65_35905 [archaeon]
MTFIFVYALQICGNGCNFLTTRVGDFENTYYIMGLIYRQSSMVGGENVGWIPDHRIKEDIEERLRRAGKESGVKNTIPLMHTVALVSISFLTPIYYTLMIRHKWLQNLLLNLTPALSISQA